MSIEFVGKNITTHVGFKAWDESWSGTRWAKILDPYGNLSITITSTDGDLDEVEIRASADPGKFVVIQPEDIKETPAWLRTLVQSTVELV